MNAMNLDSFAAAAGITVYREASCTVSGQSLIDDLLGAELLAALRATAMIPMRRGRWYTFAWKAPAANGC